MESGTKENGVSTTWVVIQLKNQEYAVPGGAVRELVILPEVCATPNAPDYIRGTVNMRGRVLPLVDLRRRLGFTSAADQTEALCQLMQQREDDHTAWLKELEASIQEDREFTLATDPHQCAFGRWHDSYRPESPWLAGLLKRFEDPHRRIHEVATSVAHLLANSRRGEAFELVDRSRDGVLSEMLRLFKELRALIRDTQKELAMVIGTGKQTFTAAIDAAVSVERFVPDSIRELPEGLQCGTGGIVHRLGFRQNGEKPTLIIEPDRVLGDVAVV